MSVERTQSAFNRRAFLRGAGVSLALPLLESWPASRLFTAAAAEKLAQSGGGAPLRTVFLFFPNGAIPSAWWPSSEGKDFSWSRTLKPLQKHKEQLQILGGLGHRSAEAGPDGPGDHARGNSTFLTGVRLRKSATDLRAGVSIDQVLAKAYGHLTRFPSLEFTCDGNRSSGACDSGYSCAYQFNLAWTSPTTPKTPESNPRRVFERLFGEGKPGERQANLQRRQQEEKSVLDFVLDDARSMRKRLDAADKHKLDQYLIGVREVESRIRNAERLDRVKDPHVATPPGIPSDYGEHMQLLFDVMVLAFQTDSTRVATFLLAHDGSNRSFDPIGISEGHHDLTHHQNRKDWIDKVADIDQWYVRQLSRLLDKLSQVKDVDGQTLLHNSMIVYGSGNADGNRHTHVNLPILLAGSGGGALRTGRYVKHSSRPMSNLFLSMAHILGMRSLEHFGDSTGPLTDI